MPNTPSSDTAIDMLMKLQARLDRIENAPQVGNMSIRAGALQILDPLNRLVLSVGYQPDGTVGVASYNPASGSKVIEMGQQSDGTLGFAMYGPGGVKLLELGQLGAGSTQYGLTVLQGSVMQLVGGAVQDYAAAAVTTTGAPVDTFSDGPSRSATVGPSGSALVTIGAFISPGAPNIDGDVVLMVDGSVLRDGAGAVVLHALAGADSSSGASAIISGLGAGATHTFSHGYTDFGARALMQNRFIIIQPL
jgi:hypothetical protein